MSDEIKWCKILGIRGDNGIFVLVNVNFFQFLQWPWTTSKTYTIHSLTKPFLISHPRLQLLLDVLNKEKSKVKPSRDRSPHFEDFKVVVKRQNKWYQTQIQDLIYTTPQFSQHSLQLP